MWPAFNCGPNGRSCKRQEKNWNAGCPKCELTEKAVNFREETEEEIVRVVDRWPEGYDFIKMRDLVGVVSQSQSANPDRIDPDMDLTFSRLVEILQQERNLADRRARMKSNG